MVEQNTLEWDRIMTSDVLINILMEVRRLPQIYRTWIGRCTGK